MWDRISELWCKKMHSKAMWPIHGKYVCPDCLREYPVVWDEVERPPAETSAPRPRQAFLWSVKRSDTL